jgi:hypothetical protein
VPESFGFVNKYGQSFESIGMGAKEISARWLKTSRALRKMDPVYKNKGLAERSGALMPGFLCS